MEVKIRKEDDFGLSGGIILAFLLLFAFYGFVAGIVNTLDWWTNQGSNWEWSGNVMETPGDDEGITLDPGESFTFELEIPIEIPSPDVEDIIEMINEPDLNSVT